MKTVEKVVCFVCRKAVAVKTVTDRGFIRHPACACCAKKVEEANRFCKYA